MLKWAKVVILIALAPLAFACVVESCICLSRAADGPLPLWFLGGFVAVAIVYILIPRGAVRFIEVFVHELTHMLFAFATLTWVSEFVARGKPDKDNVLGHIVVPRPNFLTVLAPYFFPLLTVPFVAARLLVNRPSATRILDLVIGGTLAFHVILFFRGFMDSLAGTDMAVVGQGGDGKKSDIHLVGILFSVLFCFAANVIILLFILNVVSGNRWSVIWHHYVSTLVRAKELYMALWFAIKSLLP
jgi:hypothetical protein